MASHSLQLDQALLTRVEAQAAKRAKLGKERRQRTQDRQELARLLGRSLTEICSVQLPTLHQYLRHLQVVYRYVEEHGIQAGSSAQMDAMLTQLFDKLYLDGHPPDLGSKIVAAINCFFPDAKGSLPRAARSLKGWARLAPQRTRAPLPWLALMAMVGAAVAHDDLLMAVAMILQFVTCLRPGELCGLQPANLIASGPRGASQRPSRALLLGAFELGRANKSNEFDESVVVDRPDLPWLNHYLGVLKRRPRGAPVWDFSQEEYAHKLKTYATLSGVAVLEPDAYALRHGGASDDMLALRRPAADIKRRGRWKSDSSLRRYEKRAVAQLQVNMLSQDTLAYGLNVEKNLESLMMGLIKLPPPAALAG